MAPRQALIRARTPWIVRACSAAQQNPRGPSDGLDRPAPARRSREGRRRELARRSHEGRRRGPRGPSRLAVPSSASAPGDRHATRQHGSIVRLPALVHRRNAPHRRTGAGLSPTHRLYRPAATERAGGGSVEARPPRRPRTGQSRSLHRAIHSVLPGALHDGRQPDMSRAGCRFGPERLSWRRPCWDEPDARARGIGAAPWH